MIVSPPTPWLRGFISTFGRCPKGGAGYSTSIFGTGHRLSRLSSSPDNETTGWSVLPHRLIPVRNTGRERSGWRLLDGSGVGTGDRLGRCLSGGAGIAAILSTLALPMHHKIGSLFSKPKTRKSSVPTVLMSPPPKLIEFSPLLLENSAASAAEKSFAHTTRLEPAIKSKEKPTITKNHDSLVVNEDSGPTQAIETKEEIQLVNRDNTLEEEYEVIEHDDLVEEGCVVVREPSTEWSRRRVSASTLCPNGGAG